MFKKIFKCTPCSTPEDVASCARQSAMLQPVITGSADGKDQAVPMYDWQAKFQSFKSVPNMKKYHLFKFCSENPGVVVCHEHSDATPVSFAIISASYKDVSVFAATENDGKVSCQQCGIRMKENSIDRHYERFHPGLTQRNTLSASGIGTSSANGSRLILQSGGVTINLDRDTIDDAVCTILENHQDYSKETLCELLNERHPDVPASIRALFVNVATSSAQYVAGIEEITRNFGGSGYLPDEERVKRVARSLTSWRIGQRRTSIQHPVWSTGTSLSGDLAAMAAEHSTPTVRPEATVQAPQAGDILLTCLQKSGIPYSGTIDPDAGIGDDPYATTSGTHPLLSNWSLESDVGSQDNSHQNSGSSAQLSAVVPTVRYDVACDGSGGNRFTISEEEGSSANRTFAAAQWN